MSVGERRLAAIMFTDIVGYAHLSETNESLALELLQEHQSLLRPVFLARGGTVVKTIGDAFLVEFKSALDAVTCAVDLQRRMSERNAGVEPSRRLELRIGIHVGDVVHDTDDIYGDAVNVAARIEPLAAPGGVCISQQVFDQVRNKTTLKMERMPDARLKNIDSPQGVYRIDLGATKASAEKPKGRIAVLPFVNISPDPRDDYFADGLTEELISKLSEVKGLKVIARTSVMGFKGTSKKVSEIASELGVGSVIEGSVRKSGNRVRISVQLIDPSTEEHLWSSNYDGELMDIFRFQSDVASKVTRALSVSFFSAQPYMETTSIEAYTLYLRAMQLSYQTDEPSVRETISLLQRAVKLDPKFARAYAALADEYGTLAVTGYEDFAPTAKRAEEAALKALELDPRLSEVHAAMAGVHSLLDRFDDVLDEAETAIRINPNLAEGYYSLGVLYGTVGTLPDAIAMFKKGYELDPLSPGGSEMLAMMSGWSGDDKLVRDIVARLLEVNPKNAKTYLILADYHTERREFEEAQRLIDEARSLEPDEWSVQLSQGILFGLTGRREEAEEVLRKIRSRDRESSKLYGELMINAALGNNDAAFAALMRQAETHSWPFTIRFDPLFAKLRQDPRFSEFSRKVGLPAPPA